MITIPTIILRTRFHDSKIPSVDKKMSPTSRARSFSMVYRGGAVRRECTRSTNFDHRLPPGQVNYSSRSTVASARRFGFFGTGEISRDLLSRRLHRKGLTGRASRKVESRTCVSASSCSPLERVSGSPFPLSLSLSVALYDLSLSLSVARYDLCLSLARLLRSLARSPASWPLVAVVYFQLPDASIAATLPEKVPRLASLSKAFLRFVLRGYYAAINRFARLRDLSARSGPSRRGAARPDASRVVLSSSRVDQGH